MARKRPRPVESCPHCGALFPQGRAACPDCGSDERTGWKSEEEISYASVEIPDTYDPEVWESKKSGAAALPPWMRIGLYVLLVSFLLSTLGYGLLMLWQVLSS